MTAAGHKPPSRFATELRAGFATFASMAYIIFVNPALLAGAGMPLRDVFLATCLASAVGTALMALIVRQPFAMAPGMGLNAFFAFTVCTQLDIPWDVGLAAVFVGGAILLLISLFGLRARIVSAIPFDLVRAIAAGIGLFIAFIGLQLAGVVADRPETMVTLGTINQPSTIVALAGVALTAAFVAARVPGAVLLGVAFTAAVAFAVGVAPPPSAWLEAPTLPRETLLVALPALAKLLRPELALVIFTMVLLDLFDTMGTLEALGRASGSLGPDGRLPRERLATATDGLGAMVGALIGTSTVTVYIESAAGITAGGRTWRSGLTTAALFALMLPFFPAVAAIPAVAIAPALIIVGAMMFAGAAEIDWRDPVISIPAIATVLTMPATFDIASGVGAGFVLFCVSHLAARRGREIKPATYAIAAVFAATFIYGLI